MMTTRVSRVTVIRGYVCESTRPSSYVNPGSNKPEPLVPFGFLGWEMFGNNIKHVFKNAAQQALDREATISQVDLTTDLLPELRLIEPQVRDCYPGILSTLDDVQLKQIAVDTCLFLLVAFTMLLGGDSLGFPSQHLLLGSGRVNEKQDMWLQSMYFVGNQIPFVMVDKLMTLFSSLSWYRRRLRVTNVQPSGLLKIALHKFVTRGSQSSTPPPFDVIDCLRFYVLGPPVTNNQLTSVFACQGKLGTVSELSKQGYSYLPLPSESGVRGIRSKNTVLGVEVYLPPMEINSEQRLELMAKCLVQYEATHGLEPEVWFYLNSLCSLIRSPEDVQLLLSAKVVVGLRVDSLPKVLERFVERPVFDPSRCRRIDILSRRPRIILVRKCMKPLRWLLGGAFAINAIYFIATQSLQTLYTVLGFYKQEGSRGPSP